jgi:Cu+-exporting ATPase
MSVNTVNAKHQAEHQGNIYYFCCGGCRTKFVANPDQYLQPSTGSKAEEPTNPGAVYTCPMHPEIRQIGPGSCPICGMGLEPAMASLSNEPNLELIDMTRRFWIGLILSAPVMALEMGGHLFDIHLLPSSLSNLVQLLCATPVVLWAGLPFIERGIQSIKTRHLNMFTLIATGICIAWLYSVVVLLIPGVISGAAHDGAPVYFEAATVITVLALLGQVLELKARERTSGALRSLLNLVPKTARSITQDGHEEEIGLDQIVTGDRLRIRPGEKVPVDGSILEGRSSINEAMVTGESMPVSKTTGDKVIGGTINLDGALVMTAEAVGHDTMLARIVAMVVEAQRSRAPIQRLADRVAGWFVPVVGIIAVMAFATWLATGPEPRFSHALIALVSVLIIACPCALGLATPMSVMVGVGRGAQSGILVKNAESLERLAKIDTLVIDKTGTLTEGKPAVVAVKTNGAITEDRLLAIAASLERQSEHPLSRAIVAVAEQRKLPLLQTTDFFYQPGKGIGGKVDGLAVIVGNAAFTGERSTAAQLDEHEKLQGEGATIVHVAVNGEAAGFIAIADTIRPSAREAIARLKQDGIRIVMITGDHRATAISIAARLGISEIEAEVLPERKSAIVIGLRHDGRIVAMAGDGVNDAPALAAADVGIAMAGGTDVAIESAGITLLTGDLSGLVRARKLSAVTLTNIRQNLFFAFAYNSIGIPLAAGVLYPWWNVLLSPELAAAAMALSSVSVVANALRLHCVKLS